MVDSSEALVKNASHIGENSLETPTLVDQKPLAISDASSVGTRDHP